MTLNDSSELVWRKPVRLDNVEKWLVDEKLYSRKIGYDFGKGDGKFVPPSCNTNFKVCWKLFEKRNKIYGYAVGVFFGLVFTLFFCFNNFNENQSISVTLSIHKI